MRSLTLRIFLAFWLIIVTLSGLAALAGYSYAERLRQAIENFEQSETLLAASEVLEADGRAGLELWLRNLPRDLPMEIFVVDSAGRDLLGRRLPRWANRLLRRFDDRRRHWHGRRSEPPNLRAARPLTRLRATDGEIFTVFVDPKRHPYREWIGARAGPAFLALAVVLSALVSWVLARAISRPVRSFREATVAISEGRLDTRVAPSVRNRRDEIGKLAVDLDAMADKLQQSARRQQELTRNVSHELRSPLARLRVALELARRQAGDLAEFARIDEETERLDELIGQLLSYARLDSDADLPVEELDGAALLEQAVADANFECRSAGIDNVTVRLDVEDGIALRGDPRSLSSAFDNVLRNAVRHAPPDSDVTVRARRDGGRVIINVEDEGPGVDPANLDSLFEPFFRTSDALAGGAPGTGLGLAIAERAVQRNGGRIEARNRQSGGLVIEISLPQP